MARDDLHFRLRIPDDLKARIAGAAEENRRSMTAEILARLDASFDAPTINAPTDLKQLITDVVCEVLAAQRQGQHQQGE
ncbi:Arc family DNA-binding protein [Rhizobium sp. ARZ01]|uniref:Arc family DNA-binding protein n=1 Tax=Rhizobium sp. ARZ01 TaxID=2769313 RepID=UPI00177E68E6|nr:Arc family DNA-binding protein [Rhizobium sp. ARZ01]MBD9372088.1 Arc family DNA-binding protein [Rhizobium sp. ARZ01]